jgi:predicted nucleic-acid-binding Zn-ribbon protein
MAMATTVAETTKLTCPSCGSQVFEPGHIQSTGLIYQRLKNAKFAILEPSEIQVESKMCMNCGHIMLYGDPEKAARILKS